MRWDFRFDAVSFTRDPGLTLKLVRPEFLAYARFEAHFAHKPGGILDLVFTDGEDIALVPWIAIDPVMLLEAETSAFVWPSALRAADPVLIDMVEEPLDRWLRSRIIARFESGNGERLFREDRRFAELVEAAKVNGWLCAASSVSVLLDIAPHVYAARFADGGSVSVAGPGAANGGAFLHALTPNVSITLPEGQREAASRWFGVDALTGSPAADSQLYVGPREGDPGSPFAVLFASDTRDDEHRVAVARPIPEEILVSFDLDDAPKADEFSVRAVERPSRVSHVALPAPTGGSSGRIALVGREDIFRNRDADSDEIESLATMLTAEGFDANVLTPSHLDERAYDLIHVVGCRLGKTIAAKVSAAREQGTPVVIRPYADDPSEDTTFGSASFLRLLQASDDEGQRQEYLVALERRRLRSEGSPEDDRPHTRTLCEGASVAFVTCEREEHRLRSAFGFTGRAIVLPALATSTNASQPTTWATGSGDFVLALGSITLENNPYMLARAAARLGLPLVLCGHVVDSAYFTEVRAVLGRRGTWIPAAAVGTEGARSLLARARVVADCSVRGRGLGRLASAACAGTAIVASTTGYGGDLWREKVCLADPLSETSIAQALERAWEQSPEERTELVAATMPRTDPLTFLVSTVAGYQEAAKAVAAVP